MIRLFRARKAQITVFMIVGIILMFSSALLFYIRGQIVEGISEEFVPTIEEVPLEAQPIKIFIEDCMEKTATAAIQKLGAHGGYIDPGDQTYGSVFKPGIIPTESDALLFMEGSSAVLPYWWHMKSPNNCVSGCEFESNRPALYKKQASSTSIEGQVDKYLKDNLETCFAGFTSFKNQGFDIEITGELEPDFKVAETEGLILLKYPMTVSRGGQQTDISQFYTKVSVNLKSVYELATDIVNSELAMHFLERHTMNLISMYSKPVGTNRLPPTAHFNIGYGEYLIWTTTETKDRLESYVLPPGISMLQITNTGNSQRHVIFDAANDRQDSVSTGMMDKTQIILNSSRSYPSLEARLSYLDWWPIYLNINDQEVLQPREIGPAIMGPLLDLLGMSQYQFQYDISYPVVVVLTDPFAFNGKGFKFTYALEANIRNNIAMNSTFEGLPPAPKDSYLCDVNHRNSGMIRVEVEEMYSGAPVNHTRVDFIAGDEKCFIGYAELDANNRSVLEAKFPIGSGEIKLVKDEKYVPLRKQFGTSLNASANYTFEMLPLYTINATVTVVPLTYSQGAYIVPPGITTASLSPSEKAIFTFKRRGDDDYGEYETYLFYNATGGPQPLVIVPGEYEAKGYVILDKDLIIPKEEQKGMGKTLFTSGEDIVINMTVFTSWTSGGAIFNNVTGYLDISRSDLDSSRMVRFKALRFPLPVTHSSVMKAGPDLNQVSEHEKYSSLYRHEIEPEWLA